MKLSRISLGLAVLSAREAASLTLEDLSKATGITISSLSRSETGQRDLSFAEVLSIADALNIDADTLRTLAETFERAGVSTTRRKVSKLTHRLNEIQRLAVEAAIEAMAQPSRRQ